MNTITPQLLQKELIKTPGLTLLDVRTPAEWDYYWPDFLGIKNVIKGIKEFANFSNVW